MGKHTSVVFSRCLYVYLETSLYPFIAGYVTYFYLHTYVRHFRLDVGGCHCLVASSIGFVSLPCIHLLVTQFTCSMVGS